MSGPTTNAEIRDRYEAGDALNDGAPRAVATDAPSNADTTTVGAGTDVHVVTADGTNTVDLNNVAQTGRMVTIVHNGGANTPTVAFDDADFVGTGPADMTTTGVTATVCNVDGSASGWVVVATGSA